MLIDKEIFRLYEEQMANATERAKASLVDECESLQTWIERWANDVVDPGRKKMDIPRLYECDGFIVEPLIEMTYWPLESANRKMLRFVDQRIADSFKRLKTVGFENVSSVLRTAMYIHAHSPKDPNWYSDRPKEWVAVNLLLYRLHTTARVVIRFEQHEKYGTRTKHPKEGGTLFVYGKEQWRDELKKRRLIDGV